MNALQVALLFILAIAIEGIIHAGLNWLNLRNIRKHPVPPKFLEGNMDLETFKKSQTYSSAHLRFDQVSLLFSSLLTIVILFSGLLPWLDGSLNKIGQKLGYGLLTQGVAFLVLLSLLQGILRMPFSIYETFGIEGRFGFNKITWKIFISDTIKGFFLGMLIGLPFLYALLWFMNYTGSLWWLWAFGFIAAFQIVLLILYPTLIAPLFNKFKALEDGDLKQSLIDLCKQLKFETRNLYSMDGSRRSGHSNAYFTGFGKMRRIVLFDTLIQQLSIPELRSVLAHEIGHYKKGHIYKMMFWQMAMLGFGLWLLSLALQWKPLYQAFGFEQQSLHVGLFLFMALMGSLGFLIAPFRNAATRKHEYEADAFAVAAVRDRETMKAALLKLSVKNLSNPTPHPWYSAFHYSHPSLPERLAAISSAKLE